MDLEASNENLIIKLTDWLTVDPPQFLIGDLVLFRDNPFPYVVWGTDYQLNPPQWVYGIHDYKTGDFVILCDGRQLKNYDDPTP
jgi:hypothetical protein